MGTSIQGWGYPESHLKVAFGMKPFVTPEPEPITQLTTPLICRTTGAGYVVVSANYIKETRNNLLTAYIYIYWRLVIIGNRLITPPFTGPQSRRMKNA